MECSARGKDGVACVHFSVAETLDSKTTDYLFCLGCKQQVLFSYEKNSGQGPEDSLAAGMVRRQSSSQQPKFGSRFTAVVTENGEQRTGMDGAACVDFPVEGQTQTLVFTSRGLHCLHLNVLSLLPKMDQMCILARICKVGLSDFARFYHNILFFPIEIELKWKTS